MESIRFHYSFLSPLEKKAYNRIVDGARQCEPEIRVMASMAQVKKILPLVFEDNPQLFYVDTTQFSLSGAGMSCNITMGYHKNRAEIRSMTPRLEQIGNRFLEEVRRKKMDNLMTVRFAHDFIIRNTTYSFASLNTRQVYGDVSGITGVLFNKSAVCLGIAMTAKWLLDLAGIPSAVVEGYMLEHAGGGQASDVNHAWNLVCLNDVWQCMDVTMDLGSSSGGVIAYDYFMRSSRAMDAYAKHSPYPVECSRETGSYFVRNQTAFEKEETIGKYLQYCVRNRRKRMYFTLKGNAALIPDSRVRQIIQRNMPAAYSLRHNERMAVYDIVIP